MTIRRRDFLLGTGALSVVGGFAAGLSAGIKWFTDDALPKRRPPNILFILLDDMRWDAMGWMGNPYIRTPFLDALANRSFCFLNHFVTTSICATSRASILTGQYARRHDIWDFAKPLSNNAMRETFPWLLKSAGYHTGFIGKWGVGEHQIHLAKFMYDYYDAFPEQGDYFPRGPNGKHLTDLQADSAIAFMRAAPKQRPFCLQISTKAPHGPNLPAPRFKTHYADIQIPRAPTDTQAHAAAVPPAIAASRSRTRWHDNTSTNELYQSFIKDYYRLISGVDVMLAQIMLELEQLGMANNTCIVISSDNGHMIGEHGLWGKWIMYEESMRTPFMLYIPRDLRYGTPRQRLIYDMSLNIDIAPTLLSLSGITPPERMQGRSVLPLLYGNSSGWRDEMFYEHFYTSPPWPIVSCEGVRTPRFKYTLYDNRDAVLFDLMNDPLEQYNLANRAEHQPLCHAMRQRIEDFRKELT